LEEVLEEQFNDGSVIHGLLHLVVSGSEVVSLLDFLIHGHLDLSKELFQVLFSSLDFFDLVHPGLVVLLLLFGHLLEVLLHVAFVLGAC
jgi:hypothetical protein